MSLTFLDSGTRRARKDYACSLCTAPIHRGDFYAFQSNVYDGRAYTWRDCLACNRDRVGLYVMDYCDPDAGYTFEDAYEWATEAMFWPIVGWRTRRPMKAAEHEAARNWLARAAARPDTADGGGGA